MRNPELQRHLWLELTPHRLIAMPAVLGLIFLLAASLEKESIAWVSLMLFGGLTVLWGTQLTSESFVEEFRNGTWDTQRLSAMGPWQLCVGKLAGAPVFAWLGGALCLAVFMVSANHAAFSLPRLPTMLGALGAAILAHALGAITGLSMARNGRRARSSAGIVVIFLLVTIATPQAALLARDTRVLWFGIDFSRLWFTVASVWCLAAWSVIGVWRMLSGELQVRTLPAAWIGFAVWFSLYVSGLVVGHALAPLPTILAAVGFLVTLAMSGAAVWFEPRDFVSLRRIVLYFQKRDWRRLAQEIPCWMVTLPPAFLAALYLWLWGEFPGPDRHSELLVPMVLWLFVLRDIALLHFFSLGRQPGRPVMATLIYLGVLYWLLPALLRSAGMEVVANLLLPPVIERPAIGLAAGVVNAGAGVALVVWRWRQRFAEIRL